MITFSFGWALSRVAFDTWIDLPFEIAAWFLEVFVLGPWAALLFILKVPSFLLYWSLGPRRVVTARVQQYRALRALAAADRLEYLGELAQAADEGRGVFYWLDAYHRGCVIQFCNREVGRLIAALPREQQEVFSRRINLPEDQAMES